MGKANEDVPSSITVQDIEALKEMRGFLDGTQIIVPTSACRPETCPEDMFVSMSNSSC